ncbi:MAG: amidohydrolase [Anaerolineae bacterium]|nr:amidohydrolase [Anaerolineae bacterium]
MRLNRRTFLKQATMYGMLLSSPAVFTQSCREEPQQPDRIDIHHHILPPVYTKALTKIGITSFGGLPLPYWNAQRSLDLMERNRIATAITSISAPGIYFGDSDFAIDLGRQCNEFSATLISDHKPRFGGFAVLPLPDVDAALKEVEYALDILKLDGVVLYSNVAGLYVGAPEFDELYAELNRRKAVVYIHPTTPADDKFPPMDIPPSIMEFVFDTTRAIGNMIVNKTIKQYPDIRFIVSHAGGTAPYIAWRISLLDYLLYTDTINDLKSLYYDTTLSASAYALGALQELADPARLLFGSDYPFAPEMVISLSIFGLNSWDGFDEEKLRGIKSNNALNLFPRFVKKENG